MLDKLKEVSARYDELNKQLSDPAVISNQQEYQKLGKEHSSLSPLVEVYKRYAKVLQEIDENKELIETESGEMKDMAQQELETLEPQRLTLEQDIKVLLLPKDPNDDKNILLEIRAGAGGDEAGLFAADLFRAYTRYAEEKNWKVELLSQNQTGVGGIKEVIAMVSGDQVYSRLKFESGVHRVQRIPVTETGGRIHTSTITVAVLPEAEEVDVHIAEKDIRVDVYRASGPGGQSVNTTDSAVRLTHIPSGLVVQCQDEKSQLKNKVRALKILRARILEKEQEEQHRQISEDRKSQVGTGDRSERIRTYNYPQGRVTDHRIGLTLHRLPTVMEGDLDEVIDALRTHAQAEAMKGGA